MTVLFWGSLAALVYLYVGYPIVLWVLGKLTASRGERAASGPLPSVSLIIPVHNEAARIDAKIANTAALRYPADRLQVIFVSDGSTDTTCDIIRSHSTGGMSLVELERRGGKAAALNAGLRAATNEILVFSDSSIELEPESLQHLVRGFGDPRIGCISGEDRIPESGGEAWYGRYELLLRRLESRVHSIAGASGPFYAQRRHLCPPFAEGLAPDFLSVLRTVEQGYRAVSEESAVGTMKSVSDPRREFERKVRTLIRGMTTLFAYGHLLDPFKHGLFAFILFSHKIMRWLAPVFLLGALVAPLARLESPLYALAFALQAFFYLAALAALRRWISAHRTLPGRIALYFSSVNMAILVAWVQYFRGVRQELWTPSQR